MARKIRFRKKRLYNLRIFIVMLLFFTILVGGLLAVDINKSYVMYGHTELEIFKINKLDQDTYQLSVFDDKFNLNFKYLRRDFHRLENYFQ